MILPGYSWVPPCPVCGRPTGDVGPGACPTCGLPAVAHAALVVARIGTTMSDLARDRDELLAELRAAARSTAAVPVGGPGSASPPPEAVPAMAAPSPDTPALPVPPSAAPPPVTGPPSPPRWDPRPPPRISPQQVLLGLGALLVVAAAITFVAVAWSRFGLVFQAGVMLTVTGALCASSAWAARRGLRATEEALAAAGAALLAVDLGAARALGLFGFEEIPLRSWSAISCAVVLLVALGLGRGTRSTVTWPLAALLAAQPLPFLLLPEDVLTGPAGVAVALVLAAGDGVAGRRIRSGLAPVARTLAALWAVVGVLGGLASAGGSDPGDSWTATAVLLVAGAAVLALDRRWPAGGPSRSPVLVAGAVGAVAGLAVALSLRTVGEPGWWLATGLGLVVLVAAVLGADRRRPAAWLCASGLALVAVHGLLLAGDDRLVELAVVFLGGTVPAVVAALRLPSLREGATFTAVVNPFTAILLLRADGVLAPPVAGLLLTLLAAAVFAVATARAGQPEEWTLAAGGAVAGLTAGFTTATVGAWGQVAAQLAVAGISAGCYALVARRPAVAVAAVADLVVAVWIAVGGAGVDTPEAYTLPAAAGLLVVAFPKLRAGARSWAAEGAAVGVALVPSALVVVAEPTALRLVLVVAAAAALTVAGALRHRQAPFVLGAASLLLVTVGRLAPYAPLLPRWVTLGTAGLLLLVVGATYERRRQQAREAVAWVGQMR